ncbi:MAG TPA: histidine ammonia-lyase [Anaerolineae bacterium]|nr:histidine ammonia-lyase [Anaerolineae bacterium]
MRRIDGDMPHTALAIDGASLTIENVVKVARDAQPVALRDEARSRVAQSRAWVDRVVAEGSPTVYGVNTGFGVFASRQVAREDAERLSRNLILSHTVGVGEPLPEDVVRAAMLIRANTLAIGHSGVRPEIIDTLVAMLNRRVTPVVPEKGSLGASGDLAPLSHMALVLTTDAADRDEDSGEAFFEGRRMTGKAAMRRAGIPRLILGAKEGLALNNGATFSAAQAALAVHDAGVLLDNALVAAAMSFEALRGVSRALDERLHRVRRQAGQIEIAARLRELIAGSTLVDSTDRVQDAYSLRAIPQVLGPIKETIDFVRGIVERDINAATDNPLIFLDLPSEDKALSGANFHGEPIALAMDYLKIAVSDVASMSERRLFRLTDEKLSDGLPAMLVEHGGLNSGFMMAQYTAAALVSDNKTLAHPDAVDSIPTSASQEDFNPMSMNAARRCAEIIDNAQHVIALEMLAAAQALDLRMRADPNARLGRGTRRALDTIRLKTTFLEFDRLLAPEVATIVGMVQNGSIARAAA